MWNGSSADEVVGAAAMKKSPGIFVDWKDIGELNVSHLSLFASLVLAIFGITFVTFYLSRVIGWLATRLLRWRYGKWLGGHVSLGSFSVSMISGKVMFRDVKVITDDFSLRIQDGWLIFRYWKIFTPIKLGEDFSRCDARVLTELNGVEFHQYNRLSRYRELDALFGLHVLEEEEPKPDEKDDEDGDDDAARAFEESWRSLVPVIRYSVTSCRVLAGNSSLPATLKISFENAQGTYTTKKPSTDHDWFMHSLLGTCENFRVALVRTAGYAGDEWEDPPRLMGDGFVVVQTAQLDFYHYQDRLGRVTEGAQDLGDPVGPVWGTDVRLGKNTALTFGPWADKHRDRLYAFFFPPDYQPQKVTEAPTKGQSRVYTSYSLGVVTLYEAKMDIVFLRGEDPNALHLNFRQGSSLQMEMPWTMGPGGFVSRVSGLLMHCEAASSLEYRQLAEAETIQFDIAMRFPLHWDANQVWDMNFSATKATAWIVYSLKTFIQDLLDEWAGDGTHSLGKWVPYRWNFGLELRDFELILLLNSRNWIDTSSHNEENIQAALRGRELDLSFCLPFDQFLPVAMETRLAVQGKTLELALWIPTQFVMGPLFGNLDSAAKETFQGPDAAKTPCWANVTERCPLISAQKMSIISPSKAGKPS